ncbi:hypothetical protein EYF80_005523 [Liparis tanakae]|uniref:Uncharacterized protein n=1 Tax=Liparis tanakae TaxID=230148 RepID=A0A4Z2J1Y6_9TELE|nr:hypothetical protein EYF80_005523 [Liparis tanakae]
MLDTRCSLAGPITHLHPQTLQLKDAGLPGPSPYVLGLQREESLKSNAVQELQPSPELIVPPRYRSSPRGDLGVDLRVGCWPSLGEEELLLLLLLRQFVELMQSLSEPEDKATQPRSRSRYGGRWALCSTCAAAAGAPGGGGQCFLLWQNHSSTVPKMNTIPAGMPMMTGQGRELEVGENMGMMGGFVSGEAEERKIKTVCLASRALKADVAQASPGSTVRKALRKL